MRIFSNVMRAFLATPAILSTRIQFFYFILFFFYYYFFKYIEKKVTNYETKELRKR
jgi:ABC-type sugar transport system permease subunit